MSFSAALTLAACNQKEPVIMTLPDPPAPIVRPAEYAFGDQVASAEEHLVGQIDQALRARFGKPAETHLTAPAGTDFAAVRHWYGERAQRWQPLPDVEGAARAGGGHGFGFTHGDQAFVMIWLTRHASAGANPVTILRYGKDR
ncbi:hypothetical protein ACVWZA_002696 [Sphingomonas sp. UYAg733]